MGSKEKLIERFKKLPKDFTLKRPFLYLATSVTRNTIKGLLQVPVSVSKRRDGAVHRHTSPPPREHNESVDDESNLPTFEE